MIIETPIGELVAAFDENGALAELHFESTSRRVYESTRESPSTTRRLEDSKTLLVAQLRDYFAGTLHAFDFPLAPRGTPFQLAVWNALSKIPWGETISYADLAQRIGKPSAVRAVGAANGANPIPIVIPCHRVIGSNGSLTGYGGGIERKQWLLAHEGRRLF